MTISIELPPHAQELLRHAFGDQLNRAALESLALEGYRAGKLSHFEVQEILGFDNQWDTDEWLGAHGAHMHYTTADLETDRRNLEKIFGTEKS